MSHEVIPLELTFTSGYFQTKSEDGVKFYVHGVDKKKFLEYLPQILNLEDVMEAYNNTGENVL